MLRRNTKYAFAIAALAASVSGAASAQQYGGNARSGSGYQQGYGSVDGRGGWDRDQFWRDAPESTRARIDWLQQRIRRGVADGSLDQREANQSQRELNDIRRMAMRAESRNGAGLRPADRDMIQGRLDDLSQRIRWNRQDAGYNRRDGVRGQGALRDPYATDYDAVRDYRDGTQYQERRLAANDQVYRGSDGRYYCKRNDGTTGLIVGGVGGGVLGNLIDGGNSRVAGTLIGGALGALAGKTIDQSSDVRCR